MTALFLWLVLCGLFFFFLYSVIRNAINNSKLTQELTEIKKLLQARQHSPIPPAPERTDERESNE
ncbi:hypothetical protein [Cohnella fermenti]|uniref:DUF4083 domain-containing protein n=1 Tax=Cohnella fermenti TaxID=2565925 RepID=A0A4S4BH47_9BACL|nr:hypothetical protein [Cohnella fermenti]THF72718.1 hypothetical protein E6C55_32255 [Cohnella fermenti]